MKDAKTLARTAVGYWSIISGAMWIAAVMDLGNVAGSTPSWFVRLPVLLLYAVMIASGLLILKGRWLGVWLLVLSQLPQLPVITYGNIAYMLMPAPSVELDILPLFGIHFASWGRFWIDWNAADLPFQASVSAGALFLFVWCVIELGGYPSKVKAA